MLDKFNRKIDYARISVTDRCNLRCTYCMPDGDNSYQKHTDILSDKEIIEICKSLARLGTRKIKITGGEPLVRKNIISLIEQIKSIENIEQVTLTTNAILLDKYLEELKRVDIDGLNISIDAIDKELFEEITGFDKLSQILSSIDRAYELGIKNIKLNCVLIKGINEDQYTKLISHIKDRDICIKFIEMMPIGLGKEYGHFSLDEAKEKIENEFGSLILENKKMGNGPAEYYRIDNFRCKVGFIGALTHKFCKDCNRIRITSDGILKTCLHFNGGVNLRPYINDINLDNPQYDFKNINKKLDNIIESSILNKQESHKFEQRDNDYDLEGKYMAQIGG